MQGNYGSDFTVANRALETQLKAKGMSLADLGDMSQYIWNHHQDRQAMMLVYRNIHEKVKHTGGVEMIERFGTRELDASLPTAKNRYHESAT